MNAQEQNGVPWSLWITVDVVGRRLSMAIPKALVTSAAEGAASIDHPTTRREYASSTTAQYTLPSRVGCSVMSVTPKFVWLLPPELPSDAIGGRHLRRGLAVARPTADALDASCAHQPLDRLMAHDNPLPEHQLGPNAASAVGPARLLVHLPDAIG